LTFSTSMRYDTATNSVRRRLGKRIKAHTRVYLYTFDCRMSETTIGTLRMQDRSPTHSLRCLLCSSYQEIRMLHMCVIYVCVHMCVSLFAYPATDANNVAVRKNINYRYVLPTFYRHVTYLSKITCSALRCKSLNYEAWIVTSEARKIDRLTTQFILACHFVIIHSTLVL